MKRAVKIFLAALVIIVVIIAVGLFAVTQLVNPNDFKPQIRALVLKNANLDLQIPGNLEWQFWPSLSVTMGRTEARLPGHKSLFAAFDSAQVGVAIVPLLSGKIDMDGLTLNGLEVNLKRTAKGANWAQIGANGKSGSGGGQSGGEGSSGTTKSGQSLNFPLSIPSVTVTNASVHYQDVPAGTNIHLDHININARNVRMGKPFPIQAALRYRDQNDRQVKLTMKSTLVANPGTGKFVFEPMTVNATLAGLVPNPVSLKLAQKLAIDLDEGRADATDVTLEVAGTKTTGHMEVSGLGEAIKVAGMLTTEPFDANDILKNLGEKPIRTRSDKALSRIAMTAKLSGPPGAVMLNPLQVSLDDSKISGKAGIADLHDGMAVFDLKLDHINLNDYLPPQQAGSKESGHADGKGKSSGLPDSTVIPVDLLRPLKLHGSLKIGQLTYRDVKASDVNLRMIANNGVLKLTRATGKALGGSFDATALVDASGKLPRVHGQLKLSSMQIAPIAKLASGRDLAKGVLDLKAIFDATGATRKALVGSANGRASLKLADAVIRGVNLYNRVVGGVNHALDQFGGVSALIPGLKVDKLAREASNDTRIISLTSDARLERQILKLSHLKARLEKGTITGSGRFDTGRHDFDVHVGLESPSLGGHNKYLKGVSWPIECSGNIESSPAHWCRPDADGFRKIVKRIAGNEAKNALRKKLGLGSKNEDTGGTPEHRAKEKLKNELGKKLSDQLESLFH